jgi:hypothetical protein
MMATQQQPRRPVGRPRLPDPRPATVPCKWCGEPSSMAGTKECDRHWELRMRIEFEPKMARHMLDTLTATKPR